MIKMPTTEGGCQNNNNQQRRLPTMTLIANTAIQSANTSNYHVNGESDHKRYEAPTPVTITSMMKAAIYGT
jgi:hypothetical protein